MIVILRVWCPGARLGGSDTGSVRFERGASCDVRVVVSESGTASSSPSRRARPWDSAEYLSVVVPLGRSLLKSISDFTWIVGKKPFDRYCSTHCCRASGCLRFMRISKAASPDCFSVAVSSPAPDGESLISHSASMPWSSGDDDGV